MLRYRTYPTLNYSRSQSPMRPRGFLWHTTEGEGMSYLLQLLSGEVQRSDGVRPSTHFLIGRNGDTYELAPWKPRKALVCWHAGRSEWAGLSGLNRYLLGVELEHVAGRPYPALQVAAAVCLATEVRRAYGREYRWEWGLLTHKEVAWPRGRKSDPTAPWDEIKGRIYAAWKHAFDEEEADVTDEEREMLQYAAMWALEAKLDAAIAKAHVRGDAAAAVTLETKRPKDIEYWRERWGVQ